MTTPVDAKPVGLMKPSSNGSSPHTLSLDETLDLLEESESAPGYEQHRVIRAVQHPRLEYRTLATILLDPTLLEPPTPEIPFLAYAGRVTLLAAREKAGKSTLLSQAVSCYTTGTPFLGHAGAVPGRVLWYSIDEPLSDTVRRFHQFGADGERVVLCTDAPTAAEMAAAVQAHGANIVIVDTLGELMAASATLVNDRDAMPMAAFLRPYINVARELGCALVLLYHTGKSGREYRGTTAIGAAVDAVLRLRPPNTDMNATPGQEADHEDGRRILEGRTRWGRVCERLAFDGERYSIGNAPLPLTVRALHAYSEGDANSASQLAGALGIRKDTALDTTRMLMADGLVRRDGKNVVVTAVGEQKLTGGVPLQSGSSGTASQDTTGRVGTGGSGSGTDPEPNSELVIPAPVPDSRHLCERIGNRSDPPPTNGAG